MKVNFSPTPAIILTGIRGNNGGGECKRKSLNGGDNGGDNNGSPLHSCQPVKLMHRVELYDCVAVELVFKLLRGAAANVRLVLHALGWGGSGHHLYLAVPDLM